jgi:hypothetical protein
MMKKLVLVSIAAFLALAATSAFAGITGTTGDVLKVAPPASVEPGATEDDTEILVFQERGATTLGADLGLNITQPGYYFFRLPTLPTFTPGTLSAGTEISGSYFLHFDPLTTGISLTGSVSFDCPVVGVIVLTAQLDASDGLGAGGTSYPTGTAQYRGVEWEEWVDLSADRQTLSVRLDEFSGDPAGGGISPDQIRVITLCDIPGGEGCTPGYWKNHLESWLLDPGADFDTTFGVDYFDPDITLGQAIRMGGGGYKKLARHGTAALLNAVNPGVNYPLSMADVMIAVQVNDSETLVYANELSDECPAISTGPSKPTKKKKKK